ncbi:Asp-tRNA(Asn)/Glu-tRNA(Gln) amidotransferase subunit GatC [Mycoplasmopsis iners]|uniref:Asp-tRNA(Asn)/Glu-tRNA(Gln) amidotransferase subunit GatC n=1 Tax=Mycoplasmopsis iners TaxID=76630 RepID=UPI000497A00C|nr:Asp-tRNA(Asn)/Glu-tRNA(Gln) amidotransferase subunit GatC [Mycoplasmopsis iners]
MQKIDKEKLKSIVASIMLEPKNEVLDAIIEEWHIIENNLRFLDKLDLQDVKPLTHLNEIPLVDFLREDVVDNSFAISKMEALNNAKEHDADYIITKKVVK